MRTLPLLLSALLALPCAAQFRPVEPATADVILSALQDSSATLHVVNIWATWCAPCVEEFPDLMRLDRDYADRGVVVTFVSADFEDERVLVDVFLREKGWNQRSFLKTGQDDAFVRAFSADWTGAVPATFVFDAGGKLLTFWEGKASYEQLVSRLTPWLHP